MKKPPKPIASADRAGRQAGAKFKAPFDQGHPLSSVPEVRPKDIRRARAQAYEMIDSLEEAIRDAGRFWLAYLDAMQSVFPQIKDFC